MSVEVLAALFGGRASPANQGGTNYATSGAKNTIANTPLNNGFPNAIPTVTQFGEYLKGHQPTSHDLFVIASGSNDVAYAVDHLVGTAQTSYIEDEAKKLASAIAKLQSLGARYIIVTNLWESFGAAAVQAGRHLYNVTLGNALIADHVKFAWADSNGVRKEIVANPALFGMQHVGNSAAQTACPPPNPVLNITTAWSLLCSANSPVTQPTAFADHTLFADDGHWASGGQKILGSYYYCLAIATWPQLIPPPFTFPPPPRPPVPCSDFKLATKFPPVLN
jgi:outer membrane lipase/esterase